MAYAAACSSVVMAELSIRVFHNFREDLKRNVNEENCVGLYVLYVQIIEGLFYEHIRES